MIICGDHHDDDIDNDNNADADEDNIDKNQVCFFMYCFVFSFLNAPQLSTMNLACQDLINISDQ